MQFELPLADIRPGRFQPRQNFNEEKMLGLATSIRDQGLINSIIVFENEDKEYELIAGERRWRASCAVALANKGELEMSLDEAVKLVCRAEPVNLAQDWFFLQARYIKAELVNTELEDMAHLHQVSVVDNIQRDDLSPIEVGQALLDLKKEYGYSIRKLAEVVGQSKSWVEDRLKMTNLVPEVAEMVAANSNGTGSGLDITLARDIARKIPADLQAPISEWLNRQAMQGIASKELQKHINHIGRFVDPNRWSLSNDFDLPYNPTTWNRARLILTLLEETPPEQLAKGLTALLGSGGSWEPNYLSKKVATILGSSWDFDKVVQGLTGKHDPWLEQAGKKGWTCEQCVLNCLTDVIDLRDEALDSNAPCDKISRWRSPETVTTCQKFIGPEDPVTIVVPYIIASVLDETHGKNMLKRPLNGEDAHYVTSWQDYAHVYNQARILRQQAAENEAEEKKMKHLGPMKEYWQAQGEGTLFALENFQAHACRNCARFREGEEIPCELALKPLRSSHDKEVPRSPYYGVLVDKTGVPVPRCEKFRYRELPPVQPFEGYELPNRDLILDWFKLIKSQGNVAYYGHHKKIYGILAWLPRQLEKLLDDISDNLLLAILQAGVQEIVNLKSYTSKVHLIDPITGENVDWHALNWDDFIARKRPYAWTEDWPLPWQQGSEATDES